MQSECVEIAVHVVEVYDTDCKTVKFPITSSPRARRSNWINSALYSYMIVAVSLHKTYICVFKSLVKIAAVSWHSLRRFIKPAPGEKWKWTIRNNNGRGAHRRNSAYDAHESSQ